MNKLFKRIAVLLCCAIIAPSVLSIIPSVHSLSHVEAAAKAKLYNNKSTIGIAATPEYLYIENKNYDAKYTFTSKNKKIATVNKYGQIIGVSKGKTDIVVKETYKKKTTTVGTLKVTVVPSKLGSKKLTVSAFDTSFPDINYFNYKAKYTLKSNNNSIVTIDKNGYIVGLKEGTAKVTVTETYKKVKRNLGTINVTVKFPSIHKNSNAIDIGINRSSYPYSLINIDNMPWNSNLSYESADSNIVSVEKEKSIWGEEELVLKGNNYGTTDIAVFIEYNGQKYEIGKVTVTVKDIPVTEFGFNSYYADEDGIYRRTYYIEEANYVYSLFDALRFAPDNTSTPMTFTSSDENVAKVDNKGNLTIVSKGTATITATCGSFTATAEITIKSYDEW